MEEQEEKRELLSEAKEAPKIASKKEKSPKLKQLIQILKFTGFSISAGVIQIVSFGILYDWTKWLPWWPAYLISLILSVVWNFTFNRKFTFAAANNVPLAMGLVIVYYCMFTPVSVFGGDAIAAELPENLGMLVTFMMMLVNFSTEFIWDKFIVFNAKVTSKIERLFKKKANTEKPETDLIPADVTCEPLAEELIPERLLLEEGKPLPSENEAKEEPDHPEETKDGAD